jgi:hypothetical protein
MLSCLGCSPTTPLLYSLFSLRALKAQGATQLTRTDLKSFIGAIAILIIMDRFGRPSISDGRKPPQPIYGYTFGRQSLFVSALGHCAIALTPPT